MRHTWVARVGVVVVVGGVAVASLASEGRASSSVVANRPATYTLPSGCGPSGKKFQCNPVTNAGCDRTKDEACDDDEHGGFGCYPGPNTVKEGGVCDDDDGCLATLGCDTDGDARSGTCKRFCCTNAECGAKSCVAIDKAFGALGFCN